MKIFSLLVFLAQIQSNNLVIPQGGTPQLLIPAAGSVQGANGTFFRSDITLVNYTDHAQHVQLRWLPQGVTGNGIPVREVILQPLSGLVSEDFVGSVMGQSGLGAILVTGVASDGFGDSTARLFATSRIWSNQPGLSNGTVSQSFPSLPTTAINSSTQLSLLGLRRDDRYRLNVGIVNLDSANEQRYQIIAASTSSAAETITVTVPPRSLVQTPIVGGPLVNLQINVTNVSTPIRTDTWIAYASSVDNTTGDAWSEIGFTAPPNQP
jgi:hypothetical protein